MPCGKRLIFALAMVLMVLPLCVAMGETTSTNNLAHWFSPELQRLEIERHALEQTLNTLPPAPVPHLTGRLGYHSSYSNSSDTVEWVELNLGHAEPLDAVVIIAPPPSGDATEPGYGFPQRFRVELLGDDEQTERTVIADYTHEDFANPGLLPVVIPAGGRAAHKVRITATRLFRENNRYLFALGEVMLLQGHRNLGAQIEAIGTDAIHASSSQGTRPDWGRINVVDGHTVLGPPLGGRPSPTLGFRSQPNSERREKPYPWVSVDLGSTMPIEEVRLFPAHPPEFAHSHGYGFPVRYQIELRESADAAPFILPAPQGSSYSAPPGDNVVTLVAADHVARFVRLTVLEPHVSNGSVVLALAEMQVWSDGKNMAPGRSVTASDSTDQEGWSNAALVDGFASRADIVDWPAWLTGLSKRRETLQRLAVIEARQAMVASRFKTIGWWLVAALLMTVLTWLFAAYLLQSRARRLEMEALRQRISRDLHDEIGSSLGSIALISQDVIASGGDAAHVRSDLIEIQDIARETVDAMRDIVRLVQSDRYGQGNLTAHLREAADRSLRTIPHTLVVEADEAFNRLPMDRQRDLMLIFKEVLHNITRHASATQVDIRLSQHHRELILTVQDNGCGFDPASASSEGMGLVNLRRRAAKIGGQASLTSAPTSGTTLTITLPAP